MIRFFWICLLGTLHTLGNLLYAQNLVPNSGFEILNSCPDKNTTQQISLVPPWNSPNLGSPNIYNACSTTPSLGVPSNSAGYELAHGGNGYAGIETSISTRIETEYIQVQLNNKLQKDKDSILKCL